MNRLFFCLIVLAAGIAPLKAQPRFILAPPIFANGAVDNSTMHCQAVAASAVSENIEKVILDRKRTLSETSLLKREEAVLTLIPIITMLRDFTDTVGGTIQRHSIVLAGQLQVVDPWTNFSLDAVTRQFTVTVDIGFDQAARESEIVASACKTAAESWTEYAAKKVRELPLASSGLVQVVPVPKSFRSKRSAVLLVGEKAPISLGRPVRVGDDWLKVVDIQPQFALLDGEEGEQLKNPTTVVLTGKTRSNDERPMVSIDSQTLARELTEVASEVDLNLGEVQITGLLAGYLSSNEEIELLMESVTGASGDSAAEFEKFNREVERLSVAIASSGGVTTSRSVEMTKTRTDNPDKMLTVRLRLAAYQHETANEADSSRTHTFSMGIVADVVTGDNRLLETLELGEIRKRIEKKGVRDIDNRMTVAFLLRSLLIAMSTKINKYLSETYTPIFLRQSQRDVVEVKAPSTIVWPKNMQPLQPIRVYRQLQLTDQEATSLHLETTSVLEFKEVYPFIEITKDTVSPKDQLMFTQTVSEITTVAVKPALDPTYPSKISAAFGVAGVLLGKLQESRKETVQIQMLSPAQWAYWKGPGIDVSVSDTSAVQGDSGCVAQATFRLWAGPNVEALATRDRGVLYYLGKQYKSAPTRATTEYGCSSGGLMQFLSNVRRGVDGEALKQALFKR